MINDEKKRALFESLENFRKLDNRNDMPFNDYIAEIADFTRQSLESMELGFCNFTATIFHGAFFKKSKLNGIVWESAKLNNSNVTNAKDINYRRIAQASWENIIVDSDDEQDNKRKIYKAKEEKIKNEREVELEKRVAKLEMEKLLSEPRNIILPINYIEKAQELYMYDIRASAPNPLVGAGQVEDGRLPTNELISKANVFDKQLIACIEEIIFLRDCIGFEHESFLAIGRDLFSLIKDIFSNYELNGDNYLLFFEAQPEEIKTKINNLCKDFPELPKNIHEQLLNFFPELCDAIVAAKERGKWTEDKCQKIVCKIRSLAEELHSARKSKPSEQIATHSRIQEVNEYIINGHIFNIRGHIFDGRANGNNIQAGGVNSDHEGHAPALFIQKANRVLQCGNVYNASGNLVTSFQP